MTKNLRHAGSFFLKIGAAIFCFGHIIHMTLNGVKHIYSMQVASKENLLTWSLFQSSDEHVEELCGQVLSLVYDFVHATFSLLQLYFIFKYGNVIVNKRRWLARITFAHCISSCISFWVYTLYSGTLNEIIKKYFPKISTKRSATMTVVKTWMPQQMPHTCGPPLLKKTSQALETT